MQMKNLYYFFSLEICMGYGKDKKNVNAKETPNFLKYMWIRNRPGLNKISILFTRHLASIQWKSFGLHRCLLIWKRISWYCLKLVSFVFYYLKKTISCSFSVFCILFTAYIYRFYDVIHTKFLTTASTELC